MMLFAITAKYKVTKSVLGIAIVTAIIGVRQGSKITRNQTRQRIAYLMQRVA